MIKDNYLTIQGWMHEVLQLKGNELLAYGLIFGFCQAKNKAVFTQNYLIEWLGTTKRGLRNILKKLEEKNLIQIKRKNGSTSEYCINWEVVKEAREGYNFSSKLEPTPEKSSSVTGEKSSGGGEKSSGVTGEKSSPVILDNNICNTYIDNINTKAHVRTCERKYEDNNDIRKKNNTKRFLTDEEIRAREEKERLIRETLEYDWTKD